MISNEKIIEDIKKALLTYKPKICINCAGNVYISYFTLFNENINYRIGCDNCGLSSYSSNTAAGAIFIWNDQRTNLYQEKIKNIHLSYEQLDKNAEQINMLKY